MPFLQCEEGRHFSSYCFILSPFFPVSTAFSSLVNFFSGSAMWTGGAEEVPIDSVLSFFSVLTCRFRFLPCLPSTMSVVDVAARGEDGPRRMTSSSGPLGPPIVVYTANIRIEIVFKALNFLLQRESKAENVRLTSIQAVFRGPPQVTIISLRRDVLAAIIAEKVVLSALTGFLDLSHNSLVHCLLFQDMICSVFNFFCFVLYP